MKKKHGRYHINPIFLRLNNFLFWTFGRGHRLKASGDPAARKITGPYLMLINHVGTFDPFLVGHFMKQPPHFVSSDAVMKDKLMGWLLTNFGVITKKKNVRDSQVIREIMAVVKDGGAVGLFPEGSRTWSGKTLPMEDSIGKLVKMLKVPVVVASMKGMHLSNPRWGTKPRKATVEIDYQFAFTAETLKEASYQEVTDKIRTMLQHDEMAWQRERKVEIKSKVRAEYISFVLFYCPSCQSIGKIHSEGNDFECTSCGMDIHINKYGFFESKKEGTLPFDNIQDWYDWQKPTFEDFISLQYDNKNTDALFEDEMMHIYKEGDDGIMEDLGMADLFFFIDRLEIRFHDKEMKTLWLKDIDTLNPQFKERIELLHQGDAFRFVGDKPGVSGLKWEIAANAIWQKTEQGFKTSTYLK